SMHATITKQLDDLGSAVLLVPATDVDGFAIRRPLAARTSFTKLKLKPLSTLLKFWESMT
ncbi:MAG: hypothetical protein PHP32_06195, partial [Candidatus Izemoplasmatales bacterium]|nr:hypothetical protein [Candidatus Izemoplasmatales bacterium]